MGSHVLGLVILIISDSSTIRTQPYHNYYHSLIVDESIHNSPLPKVYRIICISNQNPSIRENSFLWIESSTMQRLTKILTVTTISRKES